MQQFYPIVADAILIVHVLIVLFNVVSLPLIWLGWFLRWRFVRNFYFRVIHLAMIAYIAAQALVGEICPLTDWENALRVHAGTDPRYATSFIGHWLQRLLFYEADERVFTIAYVIFFALVLATLFFVKPNPPRALWKNN
jgi:hypothetical protein